MNKYFWRTLINPRWWLRNHRTNKHLDRFFRKVLDHKNEVRVVSNNGYELDFEFRDDRYRVWISNKPYAYLHRIDWGWKKHHAYTSRGYYTKHIEGCLPARATALEFMETIETESPKGIQEFPVIEEKENGETH